MGPGQGPKNEAKHGVSFTEASEVFSDILSSIALDPDHSDTEERFVIFGKSAKQASCRLIYGTRCSNQNHLSKNDEATRDSSL